MELVFKKTFVKQFKKLNKPQQNKVDQCLEIFMKNPFEPSLKNHALKGRLFGKRAISAAFDLRLIFELEENYVSVIMVAVETHNWVY